MITHIGHGTQQPGGATTPTVSSLHSHWFHISFANRPKPTHENTKQEPYNTRDTHNNRNLKRKKNTEN